MRSTSQGLFEHELDGVSRFVFYRHGAQGEAYYSLVASGENAWYPHYAAGKRRACATARCCSWTTRPTSATT